MSLPKTSRAGDGESPEVFNQQRAEEEGYRRHLYDGPSPEEAEEESLRQGADELDMRLACEYSANDLDLEPRRP